MFNKIILFFLENKLITLLLLGALILWGISSSPFDWNKGILPSDPVPVDAIPDIGENQQIVYTDWPGRSPHDIDDQITYPLTTALLGIPNVKSIRSYSIFGLSTIYIIFDEQVDFFWSRTRILEKLNALPVGTIPETVQPSLGPDATALGQIYWYTLEGRDKEGNPNGGWDPFELRTIQDYYVKYALTTAKGVSEVASIGGFVKEYQIDIDPQAMKANAVSIPQIMLAVKESNLDIGARSLEFNRVEYLVRSIGYVKSLQDLEKSVVRVKDNVPILLKDVARISYGPATRRGGLDKDGVEAVGGVVVARYGANPLETINSVKAKIAEISTGLPSKTLQDGSVSQVTIVPFYDRSGLIQETLGTLELALSLEVLISIIVVIIMVFNLRASIIISSILPVGVLMTFIMMRQLNVDANIVALSGIAIAIGVMVDVGIVFSENIIRHKTLNEESNSSKKPLLSVIYEATIEVAPAVITALLTTIISFFPVFALQAAEGKLFKPLAFTKTFSMISALIIGLIFIPTLAQLFFSFSLRRKSIRRYLNLLLIPAGIILIFISHWFIGLLVVAFGLNNLLAGKWKMNSKPMVEYINIGIIILIVIFYLTDTWLPLGIQKSLFLNYLAVCFAIAIILGFLFTIVKFYPAILTWCLENKARFLSIPITAVFIGILVWQGFDQIFRFMPDFIKQSRPWKNFSSVFPGLGKEFMPALDEGSFLLMPTTMPHSGISENLEVIRLLDQRINTIPEIENVVGKWGRANSALDPAPISMFENVINFKSEYILNESGRPVKFKINNENAFVLKNSETYHPDRDPYRTIEKNELIEDKSGRYFRQWRRHITSPDDIWDEIVALTDIPGLTSAPKLQPIQTRLVMLQTGMRAPMGLKIFGPDLETLEKVALEFEKNLKQVEGINSQSVFADRVVGKPYLELKINRDAIARYGLTIQNLQKQIGGTIAGMEMTTTVEGRERFPVRIRYAREYRDDPESLKTILISTAAGAFVPLGELVDFQYRRGPQMIKSENTFLVSYVIFDKEEGYAEVNVVEQAQKYVSEQIKKGDLEIPAGVSYRFTGNYENQIRASRRLMLVVPISLFLITLILYLQFRSLTITGFIFSGIFVALSGGFILIWLYGQPWFMNFSMAGLSIREMFQIDAVNLSVAVWVGFIALFGIATDDAVLISTYISQLFERKKPSNSSEIHQTIIEAGSKRIRPAMMTTATTLIALLPILTSTGKGSDIMVPMAIPIVGGMSMAIITVFVVPVCYSLWQEKLLEKVQKKMESGNE